jgi:predicted MFS family arabinose efflux permease
MSSSTDSISTLAPPQGFPLRALLILSLGVFVTVTAESLPAGLMPEMSADLDVSAMQVGMLISVWAMTVIITSIPLARATMWLDRRLVVGVSLGAFALANLGTALAPGYELAMASRVAAAIAHGLFWAVVIVYASAMLAPSHLGRGLAIVTAGGTAATVAGLPVATVIAQALGWRATFLALGAVSLILGVVVVRGMPKFLPARTTRADWVPLRKDSSVPALLALGAAAILIATAQFTSFTYIRPYFEVATSMDSEWAAGLLFIYGLAGLVGVVVAGLLADRFPRSSFIGVLVFFAGAFTVLTLMPRLPAAVIAGLLVWGFGIGAVFPLLQTSLMRAATDRTRTLASAGIGVFFNIGIAVGPWLGGTLGGDAAPTVTTAVSAVAMVLAVALGFVGVALGARRRA